MVDELRYSIYSSRTAPKAPTGREIGSFKFFREVMPCGKMTFHVCAIVSCAQSSQDADYTTMFIPYGPKWSIGRTYTHVENYHFKSNCVYYRMHVSSRP